MRRYLTLLIPLLLCTGGSAQEIILTRSEPAVMQDGRELTLPWFGGMNAPQFQSADLDGDGMDDLLIYDRAGQQFLAARRLGDDRFKSAMELLVNFPRVSEWMSVRDYNLDGVPDLFTYAEMVDGIQVFRGNREPDGLLSFELVDFGDPLPTLHFPFEGIRTPIFVSNIDYPSFEDVDLDGDLDILTFSVIGGYVQWFKNEAVERGLGADTLVYRLASQCYGGFFESGLSTALDLSPTIDGCFSNLLENNPGQPRHSGSTILSLDYDGNGLIDIMLGDISYSQLTLGLNNGTPQQAWISEQDDNWQAGGVTANIPSFPAAFHLDVDNDGDRDIIGSPTTTLNGGDVEVSWLYENVGSDAAPDFQFQTTRFLIDEMIDVGTMANVTSFDYDADGRLDLIIGNNDEYTGTNFLDSRLRLFRNVTAPGGPTRFDLVDEDYLGLSSFMNALWAFAPAFGDLDGDGDEDAVVGERSGQLVYFENEAGPGEPASFGRPVFEWLGLDAGQFSKPVIADLDRDGLQDLAVGGFDGRIRFFKNIGTATAPNFNPDINAAGNLLQLGKIDTRSEGISTGHPAPTVITAADHTLIITGNRSGTLEAYRFGLDTTLSEQFTLVTESIGNLDFGTFTNPDFGDFNGDGELELVVGNERGGVEFFLTNLATDGTVPVFSPRTSAFDFMVSPNPTSARTIISGWPIGEVTEVEIYDLTGRRLFHQRIKGAQSQVQWNGEGLARGIYVAKLTGPGGTAARRIVLH